jgi:alpha-D-ribose 1-methylphosphonate 5-triphosphate synthase subunit PhnL
MPTMVDPVFGKLERSWSTWNGQVWLENLQKSLELEMVCADETLPTDKERTAFLQFVRQIRLSAIELAVFHFCSQNAARYFDPNSLEEQEVLLTEFKIPKDVWNLIEILRVFVDGQNYNDVAINLICDFTWDEEHGIEIECIQNFIGISEGGTHWNNKDQYDLEGQPVSNQPIKY